MFRALWATLRATTLALQALEIAHARQRLSKLAARTARCITKSSTASWRRQIEATSTSGENVDDAEVVRLAPCWLPSIAREEPALVRLRRHHQLEMALSHFVEMKRVVGAGMARRSTGNAMPGLRANRTARAAARSRPARADLLLSLRCQSRASSAAAVFATSSASSRITNPARRCIDSTSEGSIGPWMSSRPAATQ
ncbi:MAG: hypothetical protein U0165_06625 [Polyangiaceae bacterium]